MEKKLSQKFIYMQKPILLDWALLLGNQEQDPQLLHNVMLIEPTATVNLL